VKILICTPSFEPSIGGIETVGALWAERFGVEGHEVIVATSTPARTRGRAADGPTYPVARRPGPGLLLRLARWADVVLHNQLSLRLALPMLVVRRPWVVHHHTWLPQPAAVTAEGRAAALKRLTLRRAHNVAASNALAGALPVPCGLVRNPYASDTFVPMPAITRGRDLVFAGRLVPDKGVALLLDALSVLRAHGRRPALSIVGEGPQQGELRAHCTALGLEDQVRFIGPRRGAVRAAVFNAHRLAVIPSMWDEPFGLVALEAMACGCVPVAARCGGLPEAVGDAGVLFERGDPSALAAAIVQLLDAPAEQQRQRERARAHLRPFRASAAARRMLAVLQAAVDGSARGAAGGAVFVTGQT
jgi:glycogen synthase